MRIKGKQKEILTISKIQIKRPFESSACFADRSQEIEKMLLMLFKAFAKWHLRKSTIAYQQSILIV